MNIYYFGCIGQHGHYMFKPGSRMTDWMFLDKNPWGHSIDGRLCPDEKQIEGQARIHQKDGWTALSFWDRSIDRRPGSNSNFLAEGDHTFDEMMLLANEHFPEVMERFVFNIELVDGE